MKKIKMPKFPLDRIINETKQVGICSNCGSSLIRKYVFYLFGDKKCINKKCKNG